MRFWGLLLYRHKAYMFIMLCVHTAYIDIMLYRRYELQAM